MTPLYALGVDPGTPSAYALVELEQRGRPRIVRHGEVRHLPYRAVLEELSALLPVLEPVHCAVEDQWLPSDAGRGEAHRAHACATIPLSQSAGGWREACLSLGWPCQLVKPDAWRAGVYGNGVRWRGQKSDDLKRLAVATCAGLYGVRVIPSHHHVAEAVLIAGWMAIEARHAASCKEATR